MASKKCPKRASCSVKPPSYPDQLTRVYNDLHRIGRPDDLRLDILAVLMSNALSPDPSLSYTHTVVSVFSLGLQKVLTCQTDM
jgi:hypothetical protein